MHLRFRTQVFLRYGSLLPREKVGEAPTEAG